VHKIIISAVKRVEFISDRMSYIILRGRWCHIIVLNVHAPTESKTDDVKDSYENWNVFDKSLKHRRFQYQSKDGRHFYTDNRTCKFQRN
jgi:hypothetical protein